MSICGALQHVLRNPEIHRRLYDELKNEFPNKNSDILIQHLEKLRYFQACIKEEIRVTCAIPRRMPRIVPDGGYNYEQYYIPSGVR
jgi:cytochrome P450